MGQSIDMLQMIYFPLPSLIDFCVTPVMQVPLDISQEGRLVFLSIYASF